MSLDKQNSRISFQRVAVSLVLFGVLYLMALRLILLSKQCPEPAHRKSLQAALRASHRQHACSPPTTGCSPHFSIPCWLTRTGKHACSSPPANTGMSRSLFPAQYSSIHQKVT